MKNIIKTINWINNHCGEICLLAVVFVSGMPFFIHNHGRNFYTFLGLLFCFIAPLFVRMQQKDGIKPSKFYYIIFIIITSVGYVSMFLVSNKHEKSNYLDFQLCIITYLGALIGLILVTLITDFIDGDKKKRDAVKQLELNKQKKDKERKQIMESYSWIKVKKYKDDKSLSWEERYNKLKEHHIDETYFLIKKIREIVSNQ